ncbi:multidrug ABC transporter permease [Methanosarcinales archaeon]|uniref:Multidrug ABC transporter permease n=1 Tax=Candidatus Syntropharchaeum caldarium TaxID=1838285 RepID=A0A1F2PB78_9EURY|nr:MAG: multidrug ABC transporter permease [Candidatus Syntrophoarchaeum caldarius]RLG34963.1 MAG: multidrug ABC transporter permease [Methanosarcinales archaeon]
MNATWYYFERDLVKWIRGKVTVFSHLVTPAAWLIFVGLTLPVTFTDNYLEYLTPGIMVMSVLFAALQSGNLVIFDKVLGFLNKFFAMPPPRESYLFGTILFITFRGIIQATVIFCVAVLLGITIYSLKSVLLTYVVLFLFGILFASIATTIALAVDDHDGYAAINSMISMPLFFTSTALMPYDKMPDWLQMVASVNPVSYAIDNARALLSGSNPVIGEIVMLAVGAVIVLTICSYLFRRATL